MYKNKGVFIESESYNSQLAMNLPLQKQPETKLVLLSVGRHKICPRKSQELSRQSSEIALIKLKVGKKITILPYQVEKNVIALLYFRSALDPAIQSAV